MEAHSLQAAGHFDPFRDAGTAARRQIEEATMKVDMLMTREVASCQGDDPCSAAARLMWECDCGAVPVLDSERRMAGIITDRDICMATWMQDRPPSAIPISAVMARDLSVCSPNDTVETAERLMRTRQIRRLPVVDEDRRLIGILSLADIVRAADGAGARSEKLDRMDRVQPQEVTATLADICQPRPGLHA
jgi:CBS domain-containing protein